MRATLVLLVAFAALLALPAAPAQTATCTKSGTVVSCNVQLHELASGGFHMVPERIDANVGDTLKLTVTNQGQSPHNLVVCGDGKAPSSTCDDKWAFTNTLDAGATKEITVASIPKGGSFYYYCMMPGHGPGGMSGELKVAGSAATKTSPGTAVAGTLGALAACAIFMARRR